MSLCENVAGLSASPLYNDEFKKKKKLKCQDRNLPAYLEIEKGLAVILPL